MRSERVVRGARLRSLSVRKGRERVIDLQSICHGHAARVVDGSAADVKLERLERDIVLSRHLSRVPESAHLRGTRSKFGRNGRTSCHQKVSKGTPKKTGSSGSIKLPMNHVRVLNKRKENLRKGNPAQGKSCARAKPCAGTHRAWVERAHASQWTV